MTGRVATRGPWYLFFFFFFVFAKYLFRNRTTDDGQSPHTISGNTSNASTSSRTSNGNSNGGGMRSNGGGRSAAGGSRRDASRVAGMFMFFIN
jgi:hypothetical protein